MEQYPICEECGAESWFEELVKGIWRAFCSHECRNIFLQKNPVK